MEKRQRSVTLSTSIFSIVLQTCAMMVLISGIACSQNEATPARVEIFGSQLLHISSPTAGKDYDIDVQLPGNYSDTSRTFPTIYVIDAQWDFALVQALYGQQYFDGFIPACIVVGITWGGVHPNYDSLRALDLSPTFNNQVPHSGNGPKFLSFIKNELVPMIDSRYRTDKKDRTLMGSSFGGLFTLYALFDETSLFNRYILTSPYLGWDNRAIDSFEKQYASKRADIPVRVFIAEGGLEPNVPEFTQYVDQLKSKGYAGLDLTTRIIEGVGHSGGKAEGYTRGLQSVFARPSLNLSSEVLDQYVGMYALGPNTNVAIKRTGDRLVAVTSENYEAPILSQSATDFYVLGQFLNIHFKKDDQGKVTGFLLERYGAEGFCRKIK